MKIFFFLPILLQSQFCHKSCDCIWVSLFLDYFVPMVYLSLLAPIPHAPHYCSFIISLDIWRCRLCAFPRLPWLLLASSFSIYILYSAYAFSQSLRLYQIYTSIWREIISLQYWVFQSMNTIYLKEQDKVLKDLESILLPSRHFAECQICPEKICEVSDYFHPALYSFRLLSLSYQQKPKNFIDSFGWLGIHVDPTPSTSLLSNQNSGITRSHSTELRWVRELCHDTAA